MGVGDPFFFEWFLGILDDVDLVSGGRRWRASKTGRGIRRSSLDADEGMRMRTSRNFSL